MCKLKKVIYGLKQSQRAWFNKFSKVAMQFGFQRCNSDHSIFIRQRSTGCVILAVYVDDILVTGSDRTGVDESRAFLKKHFVTKDLGRPRYFLGIEITHAKDGVVLSQRKYVLDLLKEAGMLGCKPSSSLVDSSLDMWDTSSEILENAARYRRLVGKLIYLTVTHPDITFAVGLVSQFMHQPREVYWKASL